MTRSLRTLTAMAALGAPLVLAGPALADSHSEPAVMATTAPTSTPFGTGTTSATTTGTPSPSASPSSTAGSESQVSEMPSGGADTGSGATQQETMNTGTLAAGGLLLATAAAATVWASRRRTQS